eukprot:1153159-Pelagomonas_calceolata.AAC.2
MAGASQNKNDKNRAVPWPVRGDCVRCVHALTLIKVGSAPASPLGQVSKFQHSVPYMPALKLLGRIEWRPTWCVEGAQGAGEASCKWCVEGAQGAGEASCKWCVEGAQGAGERRKTDAQSAMERKGVSNKWKHEALHVVKRAVLLGSQK